MDPSGNPFKSSTYVDSVMNLALMEQLNVVETELLHEFELEGVLDVQEQAQHADVAVGLVTFHRGQQLELFQVNTALNLLVGIVAVQIECLLADFPRDGIGECCSGWFEEHFCLLDHRQRDGEVRTELFAICLELEENREDSIFGEAEEVDRSVAERQN